MVITCSAPSPQVLTFLTPFNFHTSRTINFNILNRITATVVLDQVCCVTELRACVRVEPISDACRRNRLRWFGHMERKGDDDLVKRCTRLDVMERNPEVVQGKHG
jgi:hypothetical protein